MTRRDRLVALRFVEDDRAIAGHHLQKWWGDRPGIRIVIGSFVPFDVATVSAAWAAVAPVASRQRCWCEELRP